MAELIEGNETYSHFSTILPFRFNSTLVSFLLLIQLTGPWKKRSRKIIPVDNCCLYVISILLALLTRTILSSDTRFDLCYCNTCVSVLFSDFFFNSNYIYLSLRHDILMPTNAIFVELYMLVSGHCGTLYAQCHPDMTSLYVGNTRLMCLSRTLPKGS